MASRVIAGMVAPFSEETLAQFEAVIERQVLSGRNLSGPAALAVRLGVSEGTRFALAQDAPEDRQLPLAFTVFEESAPASVGVDLSFPGRGLKVNEYHAPYPGHLVGLTFVLHEALGTRVVAQVETRDTVSVSLRDVQGAEPRALALTGKTLTPVLALMALCRAWQSVQFRRDPVLGTQLMLRRPSAAA